MMTGEIDLRVRYQETDQMGVVYHTNYLIWWEMGRNDFLRKTGMSYKEIEMNKIYLPVIKIYAEYKAPARYDDEIRVVTRVSSLREVKLTFKYEIYQKVEEKQLLVLGESEHAFVNEKGKPFVLKKNNPFLWKRLLEAAGVVEN